MDHSVFEDVLFSLIKKYSLSHLALLVFLLCNTCFERKQQQKFVGVDDKAIKVFDDAIDMVNQWKPQNFQKLQTKKQILAKLGYSAEKVGKTASSQAKATVSSVLKPFLERVAKEQGTNIKEINRGYNALREAEEAMGKFAESQAKS